MAMANPNRHRYSRKPVFEATDNKGFIHKVFVMYHGTKDGNVDSIVANGLRPSNKGMLGPGVYTSRDPNKTGNYGNVTLKLLVYIGKVKKTDSPDATWQQDYDSCWLPPHANPTAVPSGKEENCIKDPKNIHILGVTRGYDLVKPGTRQRVGKVKGSAYLTPDEWFALKNFTKMLDIAKWNYGAHKLDSSVDESGDDDGSSSLGAVPKRRSSQRGEATSSWRDDGSGAGRRDPTSRSSRRTPGRWQAQPQPGPSTSRQITNRGEGNNKSSVRSTVYEKRTKSDFTHRVHIAFMGLNPQELQFAADGILPIEGGMLGYGLYVHRSIEAAAQRAPVVLKLLIAPGLCKMIKAEGQTGMANWQHDTTHNFTAATVLARRNILGVTSDLTCLKSNIHQARVLGVCAGAEMLPPNNRIRDISGDDETVLDDLEEDVLQEMVLSLGMTYMYLAIVGERDQVIEVLPGQDGGAYLIAARKELSGGNAAPPGEASHQLWIHSWGGCLENQVGGLVLEVSATDGSLSLMPRIEEGAPGGEFQQWERNPGGKLINRVSGLALDLPGEGEFALRATRESEMKIKFEDV